MTALREAPPRPAAAAVAGRLRPPWDRRRTALAFTIGLGAVATMASFRAVGISVPALVEGWGDVRRLLERMLPPEPYETGHVLRLVLETFWMAFLGTLLAVVLSLPVAFLAARNTTPHRLVHTAARGVITAARAIPDLVFALVFVRALGIGVLPGVLALGLHSIGMLGKLFADAIEEIDEGARHAVAATGATRLQTVAKAVLPQIVPTLIGVSLYRLDINVRFSTILGYVGAGGIGQELRALLGNLRYREALWAVLLVFGLILVVELVSVAVRRTLLGPDDTQAREPRYGFLLPRRRVAERVPAGAAKGPGRLSPPWTGRRRRQVVAAVLFAAVLVVSVHQTGVSPLALATSLDELWEVVRRFVPPDFAGYRDEILDLMAETVAIGVAATVLGVLAAVPVAFLAAGNVAPARWVYRLARGGIVGVRGVPEFILAVVFVAALGLGPFAGVLALSIGAAGFMSKLLADAIEEVEQGPRDAMAAVGATGSQQLMAAVVPQLVPAFVGQALYVLDINIRSSVVLGIVGAGGIGFLLVQSVRTLNFEVTSAILVATFVVVYGIERLSGWLRKLLLSPT